MTRNRLSTNANTEGTVQEFIDTSYDIVKEVHDNLDNIQLVIDAINDLNPSSFATAAQGATADSALQPEDIQSLALLNSKVLDATLINTTDARLSDARTPTAHTHSEGDILDLQTYLQITDIDTLAELNALLTDATLIDTADSRLSDSRTPTAHTHPYAELTSMPTTLAGYGITNAYTKTEIDAHTHAWGTITSKPTTLAGYGITDAAPLSHVGGDIHIDWKVSGAEVIHPSRYTDTNTVYTHPATHSFSILTNLPTTLAGYGITDNVSNLTNDAGYLIAADIDTLTELNLMLTDATLGDSADFATAAQGVLANSASQPGHTHTSVDITDMGTFLDTSDINSLAKLNAIVLDATLINTTDSRLSNARAPTAHTHTEAEITDLGSYLASTAINTLAKLNTMVTDATLIDTSDSRLSDNRDPNAHTHTEAEISDFGTYVLQTSINTLAGLNALVLDATLGDSSDFATAAQGVLADSAVQPGDIGTAAAQNVGYFATAAQGAKADTALQSIAPDSVTMNMLQDIATDTFLGRVTAVTGTVEVLTNAQAKAALDLSGTNTGDQTTVVGISSTKAQFDAACSDGNFAYSGGAFHNSFSDYVADQHLPSSTFATAAQGTLANSAIQPSDINTLAGLNAIVADATLADSADYITISNFAGRMLLQGDYNASTNTPDLDVAPSGIVKGDTYRVSTSGSFFGTVDLETGDHITALQDDPVSYLHWSVVQGNINTADFATAAQGTLADSALQDTDINTLAKLNAIVVETLIDDTHAGLQPGEGTTILSTGVSAGYVLTSQGDNSSAWELPGTVEGIDIASTTITVGKVLRADGDGTCSWITPFSYASTLTTKGDLEGHNGTNRVRLPVGTNGQILVADSAQASGIGWANPATPPSAGFVYSHASTGVTLNNGMDVFSNAGLTHTLKVSPTAGQRCRVRDFAKGAGTTAITIQRNGATINGVAADFSMDEDGQIVTFFCDTAGNWKTSSVSDVPEDPAAKTKVVTDTTYTILEADNGYRILFNNASAIAVTIPDGLSLNHHFTATQVGAGVPTLTPVTDTVNGAGTGITPDNQWGSVYFVQYAYADWLAEYSKAGSYLSLP